MSGVRPVVRQTTQAPSSFPHVLLTLDAANVISSVNGEVERLLGYQSHDLVGVPAEALFAHASVSTEWGVCAQTCRTKSGWLWKTYRRSAPMFGPDGLSMGSIELLSDALHTPMYDGATERSQKLEALGSLASGIAHDFNNLLQAIQGHATLAMDVLPSSLQVHENIDQVLKASARGAEMVRRILEFTRPLAAEPGAVDLCAVVREAVELLRASLPSSIALRTHFATARLPVLVSPSEVHQVVVNLAMNAVHAMGATSGCLEIRVEPMPPGEEDPLANAEPHAVLTVKDDGCGMSDRVRARIFDRFFTTKGARGTGLGLYTVQDVVRRAGGAVEVDSTEGVGTTFRIYLPRAAEDLDDSARVAHGFPEGHGERVLYVDDDPVLVMLGKRLLETIGYRVTSCAGSQAALEILASRPNDFEIMVSDVSMPLVSGFDLARRVRQLRPNLPVLMMSGYVGPEERARAYEVGAREILVKPVGLSDFGRALARNLRAG